MKHFLVLFLLAVLFAPAAHAQVQPGQSWDAAFDAASPGDVILLAGGVHPEQTLTGSKAAPGVTFRPVPGATVQVGDSATNDDLEVYASGVSFENITIYDNWYARNGTQRLVFRNVNAQKFYVRSANDVQIIGGRISDPQATGVPQISATDTGYPPSTNILVDGVLFERIWRPQGDSSSHRECLHIMGVVGLTIRNSVFRECLGNTSALSFNIHHSSRIEDVLVEGNLFEGTYDGGAYPQPTGTGPSVNISDRSPGYEITFRANNFRDSSAVVGVGHPVVPGAIRWESNCGVGSEPAPRDWVWSGNLWNQSSCPASAPPPPGPYEPACAPTCDEQIADLEQQKAELLNQIAARDAQISSLQAQVNTLTVERDQARAERDALQSKLNRIDAVIHE